MFNYHSPIGSRPRFFQRRTHEASTFRLSPPPPKGVSKILLCNFLRIEVTRASRGLSAIAELLVYLGLQTVTFTLSRLLILWTLHSSNAIRSCHLFCPFCKCVTHNLKPEDHAING